MTQSHSIAYDDVDCFYLAFNQYVSLRQVQKYTHYIRIYNIGRAALEQAKKPLQARQQLYSYLSLWNVTNSFQASCTYIQLYM